MIFQPLNTVSRSLWGLTMTCIRGRARGRLTADHKERRLTPRFCFSGGSAPKYRLLFKGENNLFPPKKRSPCTGPKYYFSDYYSLCKTLQIFLFLKREDLSYHISPSQACDLSFLIYLWPLSSLRALGLVMYMSTFGLTCCSSPFPLP